MTQKRSVVFVHGVGPAEDGAVLESFSNGQRNEPISGNLGSRVISGDTYVSLSLRENLDLIESGWSQFRPVKKGVFAAFFEAMALVWGMLRLATYNQFSVGNDQPSRNALGTWYVRLFLVLLFWCIHPAIISLFYTTGDYLALTGWTAALLVVIWLLGRYDRIFLWGFAWLAVSLFGCALLSDDLLIQSGAWAYIIAQSITITVGWLFMITQMWLYRSAPLTVKATRPALAFIPFFAASGLGALVWTLALARANSMNGELGEAFSFDDWARLYGENIEMLYPVFNAEMYNGLAMAFVGCLLIGPAARTFFVHRRNKESNTATATRDTFSRCLHAAGFMVILLIPLFLPAMEFLPDFSWIISTTETEGAAVFSAYATWATRVIPFLPLFFGGLAIVLKILGDVVFYLLPPSSQVVAREAAISKLKKITKELIEDDETVLIVSHSQGTMIALDALRELSEEGVSLQRTGVWLSGSPSVALYFDYLQLNRLNGALPRHVRNYYRKDDVIAGSISDQMSEHPARDRIEFVEQELPKFGGHLNYWKEFQLSEIEESFTSIENAQSAQ